MNFTDSSTDHKVGTKSAERKSNDSDIDLGASKLDQVAMEGAQKAQSRIHQNEQTNSSTTTFSK